MMILLLSVDLQAILDWALEGEGFLKASATVMQSMKWLYMALIISNVLKFLIIMQKVV